MKVTDHFIKVGLVRICSDVPIRFTDSYGFAGASRMVGSGVDIELFVGRFNVGSDV